MFEIITHDEKDRWDSMVASFPDHDVYYLHGYVAAFKIHGDGEPLLLYYDDGTMRGIYVAMLRDIAESQHLKGHIPKGELFDLISPYGYGGFIFDGEINDRSVAQLGTELQELMSRRNVVSCFTRFSPILRNAEMSRPFMDVVDLGKTIALDLTDEKVIWDNIISKNRNMIRKAMKNGIEIHHTHEREELFETFREIYNATMEHDNAEPYYYFKDDFYKSIHRDLRNNYELFYATAGEEIVAMAIMIFANGKMHYHLSGSKFEYRNLAPSNLLLYKAALWGHEQGFSVFHLGGGVGSKEDGLYHFKAAFNRGSDCRFSVGRQVFDRGRYAELVDLSRRVGPGFDASCGFFPLYRQ